MSSAAFWRIMTAWARLKRAECATVSRALLTRRRFTEPMHGVHRRGGRFEDPATQPD